MKRRTFPEAMPCRYETHRDLYDRLEGTICRYDGKLVYVRVSGDDTDGETPVIHLFDWPKSDRLIMDIKPNDPLLDISLIDMGYFNYQSEGKNFAILPYRTTTKWYKQGTHMQYVYVKDIEGNPSRVFGGNVLQSQGFVDSIMGRYPNIAAIDGGIVTEIAVSPDLAIRRDKLDVREFFWRGTKIAVKVPGQPVHRLPSEFKPLIDKILGGYL